MGQWFSFKHHSSNQISVLQSWIGYLTNYTLYVTISLRIPHKWFYKHNKCFRKITTLQSFLPVWRQDIKILQHGDKISTRTTEHKAHVQCIISQKWNQWKLWGVIIADRRFKQENERLMELNKSWRGQLLAQQMRKNASVSTWQHAFIQLERRENRLKMHWSCTLIFQTFQPFLYTSVATFWSINW